MTKRLSIPRTSREWFFGEIPIGWKYSPLKYQCAKSALYGANVSADSYVSYGIRFIRTTDISELGRLLDGGVFISEDDAIGYLLSVGDLLISRSGTVGRAYIHDDPNFQAAYAGYLVRFVLLDRNCPKFFFYLTKSSGFEAYIKGTAIESTIGNVNGEKYANISLPIPPSETQRNITEFLDDQTGKIDALVEEKEQMLSLLAEKRAALVSDATIRGINPNARLKSSGLEWLGDIPEHWVVTRTKQLFRVRDERSEYGEEELLTVSHITGVTPRSDKEVFMFKADDMSGYKRCYPGDLVVNTLWAWMGAMGVASQLGIVSPDYHVYEPIGKLSPSYIETLCRSKPFVAEIMRFSKGVWSSRLRLYPEAFFEMRLPVPPRDEQGAIVASLKRENVRSSELEEILKRSITLLKERRRGLITAAVTGNIRLGEISR